MKHPNTIALPITIFLLGSLALCVAPLRADTIIRDPFLVVFEPVQARFVRLTILGINAGNGAAIDEIEVFAPGSINNIASAASGAKAKASSCLKGNAKHRVEHLNDGRYDNDHSWIAASSGIEWIQIELPKPATVDAIAFSRDRTGRFDDRTATSFRVELSQDGKNWRQVAFFPGPGGGVRGRITLDRQTTAHSPSPDISSPKQPSIQKPIVRHEFVGPAPQRTPTGESLCLNGKDWRMRRLAAAPHWNQWPPDTKLLGELTGSLPKENQDENEQWLRVTVPGSVQTGLLENGQAPMPWYADRNFQALEQATVGKQTWFIKNFHVPKTWQGKRTRLHLAAVDYRANYYLNGAHIGHSEGHFAPVTFDVDKHIRPGKENILAVQLDAFPYDSPVSAVEGRRHAAQLARAQILANWRGTDFAPTACPLGITDDVFLFAADTVFIDDVWVRPKLNKDLSRATVALEITLDSQIDTDATLHVSIESDGRPTSAQVIESPAKLSASKNVLRQSIDIARPRLWWPNGYGPQSLYVANVEIRDRQGNVLHKKRRSFGIRKLELAFNQGHDMSPYPWTFVVNGRKIYAKGAGWVPVTPLHAMEAWRYERVLRHAKAANFTMIRWWGGGTSERPAFYELCDRLGLMVSQDFFLANNEHDNPRFLKLLDTQAPAFARRLRNHPSLALWSGGNELFNGTVNYHAHVKLWEIAARVDPDRPFTPSSPAIGVKHAITDYFYHPQKDYVAVNRYGPDPELKMKIRSGKFPDWQIIGQPQNEYYRDWIARLRKMGFDPDNPSHHANTFDIQLTAEGGASTIANHETLLEIIPAEQLHKYSDQKLSPAWAYHNARPGYYDWLQHKTTERLFGPIKDLPDYVTAAQFSRAQILAYGLEEMRRRKFRTSGTMMWQLNETWPNAAGNAIVDFFGRPRITYDFIQRVYEPVHASLSFDSIKWPGGQPFTAQLWTTSDRLQPLPGREISWQINDSEGNTVAEKTFAADIPANASIKIADIRWPVPKDSDSYFLVYCHIRNPQTAEVESQNCYVFTSHTSTPHMLAPIIAAQQTKLSLQLVDHDAGHATYAIKNMGTRDALICRIVLKHPVRSIILSDANSFCLPPGDKRRVKLEWIGFDKSLQPPDWRAATCKAINSPTCEVAVISANNESAKHGRDLRRAVDWLTAKSKIMIRASVRTMADGTAAFPPQVGSHYEAFWLRDYAYMLEGCPEAFSHKELIDACKLFVKAQQPNGACVDCVKFDNSPIYKPGYGTMGDNPVADGSQFTVDVAWHTYQHTKNRPLLESIIEPLEKAMAAVPRNPQTGMVHIKPGDGWDRCPYGFTDTVHKQGDVLFCSLLYVQAARQMADLHKALGRANDARRWIQSTQDLAKSIRQTFWNDRIGLFMAATKKCKQPDIWGSAFAVYLGVAEPEQAAAVAKYFEKHYTEIVQHGQIRHLPGGVYWEKAGFLNKAVKKDYYHNGAFWGTATGWFAYTLDLVNPKLADQTVIDLVQDYKARGVNEWVFNKDFAVPNYNASAALPLAAIRKILARRKTVSVGRSSR